MKKFVLILGLVLSFSANAQAEDNVNKQEFVNPIFYQPLEPLSRSNGYTYLTPTSIDMRTPLDKNLVNARGECELIENTQKRITLKCKYKWIPQKGLLESAKKRLQSSDLITRELAQKTLETYATTYEEYFTYAVKNLYTDTCLRIEEYIRKPDEDYTKDDFFHSNYCVTPPDYVPSESD